MIDPGVGYTGTPLATITGDGSGAVAKAVREGAYYLAKGADAIVPAGAVIPFVVDTDRRIREVGDYTARL